MSTEVTGLGDLVGDRYELGEVLGRGGSATVYRAWDRDGGRPVALKWFPAGVTGPDRFRPDQVLPTLSGLDHPGLVSTFDAGTEDEHPYLVMQLVDGPSLSARLADGPLPVSDAVSIGRHLASALRYVHAHGITHRDVKPANVLLDGGRLPLLTDLGTALVVATARVRTTDAVVGTMAYTAPEQVRGADIGPPADIYALGLVLLEAITGARTHPGTGAESIRARRHRAPVVPRDLPGGCTPLLERMTSADPAGRPDAREVVGELATVADRIDDPTSAPERTEPAEPTAPGAVIATAGRGSRRAVMLSSAAAVALAVAGGVLAGAILGGAPQPVAVPAAPLALPTPRSSVAVAPPVVPASTTSAVPQAPQASPAPDAPAWQSQDDVPAPTQGGDGGQVADSGADQGGWGGGGGWNKNQVNQQDEHQDKDPGKSQGKDQDGHDSDSQKHQSSDGD